MPNPTLTQIFSCVMFWKYYGFAFYISVCTQEYLLNKLMKAKIIEMEQMNLGGKKITGSTDFEGISIN